MPTQAHGRMASSQACSTSLDPLFYTHGHIYSIIPEEWIAFGLFIHTAMHIWVLFAFNNYEWCFLGLYLFFRVNLFSVLLGTS